MKEMSLREIQLESFNIMKEIHRFCISNNIKYSLASGTLLGAVRHKGFIPWDDDIDIIMPRQDYVKFCTLFSSTEKYGIAAPELKNSYIAYARVFDRERTFVKTILPWCEERTGIWIDIFPMDGLPADIDEYKSHCNKIKNIWERTYKFRWVKLKFSEIDSVKSKINLLVKKLLYSKKIYNLVNTMVDLAQTYDYNSSEYYGNLSFFTYAGKEHIPKDTFNQTIMLQFEDAQFCVCQGYDKYLKILYGDYMKLPPIDQRKPGHTIHKMYWRKQK